MKGFVDSADPRGKVSMKKIFGRANLKKDGTPGKVTRTHSLLTYARCHELPACCRCNLLEPDRR